MTHQHTRDWRTPVAVLVCAGLLLSLGMGIRHGFGLFLQPMTMDLGDEREVHRAPKPVAA